MAESVDPLLPKQHKALKFNVIAAVLIGSVFVILGAFIKISMPTYSMPILNCAFVVEADGLRKQFMQEVSNETISRFLRKITLQPHVAGTAENMEAAQFVQDAFHDSGFSTRYVDYDVLLSYPLKRSLSLEYPNGSILNFSLQEGVVDGDQYSTNPKIIPTFLAYSSSGDVSGEAVYANYGQMEDFVKLRKLQINLNGSIVIARLGKVFRGDIVFNAQKEGAAGVLLYSDPQEYAANRTEGYYPDSRWLPPSGVQRGSLYLRTGDPLTPGWPSTKGSERIDESSMELPSIPALPISAEEMLPILSALGGPQGPPDWHGALPLSGYRLGRGPAKLHLKYQANQTIATIRNVLGVISGKDDPDRYVLIGNHRDAWTFGAADPNSGTACLIEVARIFGKLSQQGWQPRRTIIFCSWDAEEYGLTGSTEWVEDNLDILSARAVAYLNVDSAVGGPGFIAGSTPQLDDLIKEITKLVNDPDSSNKTLYDSWCRGISDSCLDRLGGGGSDYAPFLQHTGIASFNMEFGKGYPTYHSTYDNYHWMESFGDPLFHRHVAVSKILGLLAMKLADDFILPFNYITYGKALEASVKKLDADLKKASTTITAAPLRSALQQFLDAAAQISNESVKWQKLHETEAGLNYELRLRQRMINDRLMLAERSFIDADGLPGKSWYKHLVYGPTEANVYGSEAFPGILEAIALNKDVQHEIWRVSRVIVRAANMLGGELS